MEKNCRETLLSLNFGETRLNYFVSAGIHVEVRWVNGQERWEMYDYTFKHRAFGIGATELALQVAVTVDLIKDKRMVVLA